MTIHTNACRPSAGINSETLPTRTLFDMLHLVLLLLPLVQATATSADWLDLGAQLDGHLYIGTPFAASCFDGDAHNETACSIVQSGYDDATTRSSSPNAYLNVQWEICQVTGAQCTLDYLDPTNTTAFSSPRMCEQGSVPNYYVRLP